MKDDEIVVKDIFIEVMQGGYLLTVGYSTGGSGSNWKRHRCVRETPVAVTDKVLQLLDEGLELDEGPNNA